MGTNQHFFYIRFPTLRDLGFRGAGYGGFN